MVGPNARHRRRRAVVDYDADRDPSLECNRDAHRHPDRDPSLERNRDAHCHLDCDPDCHPNCDSIYADNGDTDFDAEHNR
jgi:hypothetical protein